MTEALITGAVAIIICMINNYFQNKESEAKHDETINLISYRLDQLEEKQDKYNDVIRRTFELEKSEQVFQEKMAVANHRIDDLEQFHK